MIVTESLIRDIARRLILEAFNPIVIAAALALDVDPKIASAVVDISKTMSRSEIRSKVDALIKERGGVESAYRYLQEEIRRIISSGTLERYRETISDFMTGKRINIAPVDYADQYMQQFIPYPVRREDMPMYMVRDIAASLGVEVVDRRREMTP